MWELSIKMCLDNIGYVTRRGNVISSGDPFAFSLSWICALPSSHMLQLE